MSENLYYVAPSDNIFNEVKEKAMEIWRTYDNNFGYVDEKIEAIQDITNFKDNFMYIVAMFDDNNQRILSDMLSAEAKTEIGERLEAGGTSNEYNHFIN